MVGEARRSWKTVVRTLSTNLGTSTGLTDSKYNINCKCSAVHYFPSDCAHTPFIRSSEFSNVLLMTRSRNRFLGIQAAGTTHDYARYSLGFTLESRFRSGEPNHGLTERVYYCNLAELFAFDSSHPGCSPMAQQYTPCCSFEEAQTVVLRVEEPVGRIGGGELSNWQWYILVSVRRSRDKITLRAHFWAQAMTVD